MNRTIARVMHTLTGLAAGLVVAALAAFPVTAQGRGRTAKAAPKPGVYTDAQAGRGEALYADNCSYCHLVDLTGGELAPPLTGAPFVTKWTTRPLSDVFDYMRVSMPLNSPGGLSAQQNADLLAFLLKRAGLPAGPAELPAQSTALKAVTAAP
ncbi:MAG: c-type cytochrome [Vicinamibacterales bacterium]